jgi:hypothetical protein
VLRDRRLAALGIRSSQLTKDTKAVGLKFRERHDAQIAKVDRGFFREEVVRVWRQDEHFG